MADPHIFLLRQRLGRQGHQPALHRQMIYVIGRINHFGHYYEG